MQSVFYVCEIRSLCVKSVVLVPLYTSLIVFFDIDIDFHEIKTLRCGRRLCVLTYV